jgi:hypothetical protein
MKATANDSERPGSATILPGVSSQRSATVLVVDEYRPMCDMIAAVLRPRGYRVLTAASGGEAKALAKASAVIDLHEAHDADSFHVRQTWCAPPKRFRAGVLFGDEVKELA